jgi:hypothetical protein
MFKLVTRLGGVDVSVGHSSSPTVPPFVNRTSRVLDAPEPRSDDVPSRAWSPRLASRLQPRGDGQAS